jgi:hypothetical protein
MSAAQSPVRQFTRKLIILAVLGLSFTGTVVANTGAPVCFTGTDGILMMYLKTDIVSFRLNKDGTASWYRVSAKRKNATGSLIGHGRWHIEGERLCIDDVNLSTCMTNPSFDEFERVDVIVEETGLDTGKLLGKFPASFVLMRSGGGS